MENLQAIAVIIGVVRGVTLGLEQTKFQATSLVSFLLSLAIGILLGYLGYFGLNIQDGIVAALMATGTYQVAKKVGGQ